MKRDTRTAYRARAAATERSVDAALDEVNAQREAEAAEAASRYAERTKPIPFTPDELKAARVVRTRYGWERVVRVNAKTVTINSEFGHYRIPQATILEVKP